MSRTDHFVIYPEKGVRIYIFEPLHHLEALLLLEKQEK